MTLDDIARPWLGALGRLLPALIALSTLAAVASGCAGPRTYQPNSSLVKDLGEREALARLREVLRRAESPPVLNVHIRGDVLELQWMDTRRVSSLHFRRLESVDIHGGSDVVTLRLSNSEHPFRIDFIGARDAQSFVDLLASFYRARSSALPFPPVTRNQERLAP
ncbi:hypothetical protein [Haliangium ochraceum]|uniref:Uncharacterized protein n=1 Tax=Haliangium ochraceum (strain DSM 14365 / JCM 11303 / SMP-2) TaxID=502025 RepID=D0LVJ1_HALO1|nr:hypothetical protein [Haliangium ochraceum]ACY17552.1 hypothetical protein Hoch_5064 [Haliangium ochraceum DSM 14365]